MDLIEEVQSATSHSNKKKNVDNAKHQAICEFLLKESEDGRVKRGSMSRAADLFLISPRTIRRIWKQAKENLAEQAPIDVSSRMPTRVGRKRVQLNLNRIPEILLRRRTNIRSLAEAINVPKSTLHRRNKEGMIRPHSNTMKPFFLTDENKKARVEFCLSMLDPDTIDSNPIFCVMFDYIHIDEKWFYMTKTTQKYYLLPEEVEPLRTCKRFITKIMFLAAVARPRFDSLGNEVFSEKIGIFPFTYEEPAKRNNKNRIAGKIETKPILSVTKDIIRSCLIEKVLSGIRTHWPSLGPRVVFIQQDNAKPHIDPKDIEFITEASKDEFDIRLTFQPPNSPDMNVLDLGFFRAIQSLQHQEAPNTVDELIVAVEKSFHELTLENLNRVFLTLQLCMLEVLKVRVGNNYKLPHIEKSRLERNGDLPIQIHVDSGLLTEVLAER